MATTLNTRVHHQAPQPSTQETGFFRRVGQALRQALTTQTAPQQKTTGPDTFRVGTPSFKAAAMRMTSNNDGRSFDGRKVDPNARTARDQVLVGWLQEFLK